MKNKLCIMIFIIVFTAWCNISFAIEPYREVIIDTQNDSEEYNNVFISDSGNLLIASKKDGSVVIWDSHTEKILYRYKGNNDAVVDIATNRFETSVIITYAKYVVIIKPKSQESYYRIDFDESLITADISNSDKIAIIGFTDGTVRSINIYTKRIISTLQPKNETLMLKTIQYSLASERLLIAYDHGLIYICDELMKNTFVKENTEENIIHASLSKNSTYIITTHKNNVMKIRSIFDFKLIGQYNLEINTIERIFANYDTGKFYTTSENQELTLFEFDKLGSLNIKNIALLNSIIDVEKIAISPVNDKALLIRGNGSIIETFNLKTEKLNKLSYNIAVRKFASIESGSQAYIITSDNNLLRIDINNNKILESHKLNHNYSNIFADEYKNYIFLTGNDGSATVYKYYNANKHKGIIELNTFMIDQKITSAVFSRSNDLFILGTIKGYTIAFDINTGFEIFNIPAHNGKINDMLISGDENYLFTAGDDGYITKNILDGNYDELIRVKNHEKGLCLELSKTHGKLNTYLVSGGSEGNISVWNLYDDFTKPLYTMDMLNSEILTITHIDPERVIQLLESDDFIIYKTKNNLLLDIIDFNDFMIISTKSGLEYLIRIPDVKIMHIFTQNSEAINNAQLTGDSSYIISINNNGRMYLYDTNYLLGYGYASAGLYKEAIEFINKSYRLNKENNNYDAIIRDRKKEAEILVKLGKPYEAIKILQKINSYLEVNPISLEPSIEDGTIQNKNNRVQPKKPSGDENLESEVIEDYKYVVTRPGSSSELSYTAQLQLAYSNITSNTKYTNIIENYLMIGDIYLDEFYDYSLSRAYYKKAIDISKKAQLDSFTAKSYYKFAMATQKYAIIIKRYKLEPEADTLESIAILNTYTAIDMLKSNNTSDIHLIAKGYETFGDIYTLRNDYGVAEESYIKAYEILTRVSFRDLDVINILEKLTQNAINSKDVNKALKYLEITKEKVSEISNYNVEGQVYNLEAQMFLKFGHHKNALLYSRKARNKFELHGSTEDLIKNMLIQSQLFADIGDYDNSFSALEYALEISNTSGYKLLEYAVKNRISYIMFKQGDNINDISYELELRLKELEFNIQAPKTIEAEIYYLLYLTNRDNEYEAEEIIKSYIDAALDIAIQIYTNEYELYSNESEKWEYNFKEY